ncbi:hypothetical protein BDZ94DRAFT_1254272 [Collybia nuda]|uniref:Uncharacterized protein n=1 Tax=Collybia nuda TaxID=64659 RepID=A0A9P6CM36_9AGAR|nr:hypothetical protein BDZ94DRAFT_1254272 [Collybia nuda]
MNSKGSPAARFQSSSYGPNTPAGSVFARLQSAGMRYNAETAENVVLAPVRALAGLVGVYVLFWVIWA